MLTAALAGFQPARAQYQAVATVTYESAADFDRCTRDRFLCVDADPAGVRLARSWLAAGEQGVSSKTSFTLTATNQARKTLVLALPPDRAAELQLFHTQGSAAKPLLIRVNHQHTLTNTGEGGRTHFGWIAQPVPPAWLHAGTNEFIFSHAGRLVLDTRSPNAGSAVSYDAGQSWHPAEGEFIVRLRVGGHPPAGVLTSDILDAGRLLAPGRTIGPWGEPESVSLASEADLPRGASLEWAWRAGHTPLFEPAAWTPWQPGVRAEKAGRRFFQWRATFATDRPDRSPLLRRVELRIQGRPGGPAAAGLRAESESSLEPPRLYGSYPFTWESDTPRVRHLRDRYGLTNLVAGLDSDLARTTAVRSWTSRQWNKGWDAGRYTYIPPWDSLILLDMAPSNLCLGMCTHYATAYVQASAALGFLSRHLIADHHCLAESFLDDQGRWILQDPGPGPGPDGFPVGVLYNATNGAARNALDLHRLLAAGGEALAVPAAEEGPARSFDKLALFSRFGIPLRNNHLSVPEPAEEEHGQDHYHYDGYLWWADDLDDPLPSVRGFSLLSNRPADFYPSVNRTWLDLAAMSNGVLRVTLWTDMPHAMGFEIRQDSGDSGDWKPSPPVFAWTLRPGRNVLEARSRGVSGRPGRPAAVAVEWARPEEQDGN